MPNLTPFSHVRRIRLLASAALLATLASIAMAGAPAPSPAALSGADAYAAIDLANAWKGSDVTSFATSQAVHFVFPDGTEVQVPMPLDSMFVSVAPYVTRTHPCTTHYMSGCQGELVGVEMLVRASLSDGTIVLDEVMRTGANGFLDLWLPRDEAILLSVSVDGYAADGFLTTMSDSATCITTLRLAAE